MVASARAGAGGSASAASARSPAGDSALPAAVRGWLIVVAAMVVAMILVGGATRLTDSGLSITEWKPIHGIVPPLSQADWQEEFAKYRQIPEYALVNEGMDLAAFQRIYWWEWAHRFLGRTIGLVFALPLAFFWLRGAIPAKLKRPLLGILALGGLQGAVGWWMVASGLVDRVDVSQYRLAIHLSIACVVLAAILWVAESGRPRARLPAATARTAAVILALVFLQIFLGGLVAGLKAGWTYNTWPLLDGSLVPPGLMIQEPWWINLFENPKTVQFDHRMVAYLVLVVVALHWLATERSGAAAAARGRVRLLFAVTVAQAVIGVAALVHVVPLSLGLAHQAGAVAVLSVAVVHLRRSIAGRDPSPAGSHGEVRSANAARFAENG